MKLFFKLYGNILNFASVKFQNNLFFLKNSFSHVVTNFSTIVFIYISDKTLKVKTFSSIWKNITKIIKVFIYYAGAAFLVVSLLATVL